MYARYLILRPQRGKARPGLIYERALAWVPKNECKYTSVAKPQGAYTPGDNSGELTNGSPLRSVLPVYLSFLVRDVPERTGSPSFGHLKTAHAPTLCPIMLSEKSYYHSLPLLSRAVSSPRTVALFSSKSTKNVGIYYVLLNISHRLDLFFPFLSFSFLTRQK